MLRPVRLLVFWSDQTVHEVLPNVGNLKETASRRIALTLWFVSEEEEGIGDEVHPLASVRREHFPPFQR